MVCGGFENLGISFQTNADKFVILMMMRLLPAIKVSSLSGVKSTADFMEEVVQALIKG